jgi:isocitrate dehydrogenase
MTQTAQQTMEQRIIYTITDEAPALATVSLLPVIRAFTGPAGVKIETSDISLAGRILAHFPEYLSDEQKAADDLGALGELVQRPDANIIKLPNISASVPQLQQAIRELQQKGCQIPDYPEHPVSAEEERIRQRYDSIKGSAVNPVLREGNSDRRAPAAVKHYAKRHPHSMGAWSKDSRTHVASMQDGDFYGSEQSIVCDRPTSVRIELAADDGSTVILKDALQLKAGEIVDSAVMNTRKLRAFLSEQIADAKEQDVLLSIHLKATMMKVSDPIIFGHAFSVFFEELFSRHGERLTSLGVDPRLGMKDLLNRLEQLPVEEHSEIAAAIDACYRSRPDLAMVESDRGITNLHVSSDIIIDASMPAAIRNSGKMWGPDGKLKDTKAIIPDRSYAGVYQETIDFCKEHGAFDPRTMGDVSNVGLMAQKAEEYGSHDKTFEITKAGRVLVRDAEGTVLMGQTVEPGDIFRMCQVKDAPIRDWVKLAVKRARATGTPVIFWLDGARAHDAQLIKKVDEYLLLHDTEGLDIRILSPIEAARVSLERLKAGEDTISATGNVLRDYLTDLFPILELGTSAKMLSIVPLMNGGGLFETGAGGSAPKHVQQFLEEGHLRWDSLGEFLALAASLEHLGNAFGNSKARVLSRALDLGTEKLLDRSRSPSRKTGEIDTRGSHFYLALYWAQALADQEEDLELQRFFTPLANELAEKEEQIVCELLAAQGRPVDTGGYHYPDEAASVQVMRASSTFNAVIGQSACAV